MRNENESLSVNPVYIIRDAFSSGLIGRVSAADADYDVGGFLLTTFMAQPVRVNSIHRASTTGERGLKAN